MGFQTSIPFKPISSHPLKTSKCQCYSCSLIYMNVCILRNRLWGRTFIGACLAFYLGITPSWAAVIFTIDTLTDSTLGLTLQGSTSLTGTAPNFNKNILLLYSPNNINWITNSGTPADTDFNGATIGSVGALGADDFKATSGGTTQDRAFLIFSSDLIENGIVSSGFTISANFGANTFNVAALEADGGGLTLTWGNTVDNGFNPAYGTIQSNSPIPVPEPRMGFLISVIGIACIALIRRPRLKA